LGINSNGRFFFGNADQTGVKANIIADFCDTPKDNKIGSDSHPDLRGCCFVKTHRFLFIETPFHNGSFDDYDPLLHGNSGGEDIIDPFPEVIQILLAVNRKREDGYLIDFVGISALSD
jgi:hypothetical protein